MSEISTLQWDGKLIPDTDNKREWVDRLPVLVSGKNGGQLLGIPKLPDGGAKTQTNAIISLLEENNYINSICAMCFDSTKVNTGIKGGTCVQIESLLKRPLLFLACRHHILELVLRAAYECKMGSETNSPNVKLFSEFRNVWDNN